MKLATTIICAAAILFWSAAGFAQNKPPASKPGPSGLALPRFESLASSEVNMRAGPGLRYPISWVYQRRGLPVMIVGEFEYWRKIRDLDGAEGWVHKSLIRSRRTAVITGGKRVLKAGTADGAPAVAILEPGVIARLTACKGAWCELEVDSLKGWLKRTEFFGALPNEVFD